jgi:hypothetical protein
MKKMISVLGLVVFVLWLVVPASACEDSSVVACGQVGVEASWQHGNDLTGGLSGGVAGSNFFASDKKQASGNSAAEVTLFGGNLSTMNERNVYSISKVNSNSDALGSKTKLEVSGVAYQANWANLSNANDELFAGNYTQGGYEGKLTGHHQIGGAGGAEAFGNSYLSLWTTENTKTASGLTEGNSSAFQQLHSGDSWIAGEGLLFIRTTWANSSALVSTIVEGCWKYEASHPSMISGSGRTSGDTRIDFFQNGLNATANVTSKAGVNSGR